MSHDHEIDVDHHVKIYIRVFVALLILTGITVGIATLEVGATAAIGLALFVASVKGSLVACYFMHLLSERKLVLWVLALTVLFFFFELTIPSLTESNNLHMGS